jgi:hypothetical protein
MSHLYYTNYWRERETPDKLVTLRDGTTIYFPKLMPTSDWRWRYYPNSYYPGEGELDRYDLAQALGMSLAKATAWRHRHLDFPPPIRFGAKMKNGKPNAAYYFWSIEEVLVWIEQNLAEPAESLARKG